jgi:MFS family permease
VPPHTRNDLGPDARLIGLLLLANTAAVVVAQVPTARLAEGRRRVVLMAGAGWLFVGACRLVLAAQRLGYAALLAAVVAVGVGECLHTTALMPLVADLAPPALRGRYMASIGLSWWIGLAAAPTVGGGLLAVSPAAAFLASAGVAGAAGLSALALEPRLPEAARLTPVPIPR